MKKITSVLVISLIFLLVGCSTDIDTLQKRGDTYYKINSEKPFSGLMVNKYESGQKKIKGYLTDGKEDGIWTWWFENGQKSKEIDYFYGKTLDALYKRWYENGQKEEGTLKDGKLDGFVTEWYENGQKKYETIYKDGKLISKKEWNEDGSLKE